MHHTHTLLITRFVFTLLRVAGGLSSPLPAAPSALTSPNGGEHLSNSAPAAPPREEASQAILQACFKHNLAAAFADALGYVAIGDLLRPVGTL